MVGAAIRLVVAPELRLFLAARHRGGEVQVNHDGTASLGHVVQSVGPPLTEVGALLVAGRAVPAAYRPRPGDVVRVEAVRRPQPLPVDPPRFLLDVHLGTLARRLRLLGMDAAYGPQAEDDELVERAAAEKRVLLTQDRGLLRRRAVWCGGYVYGARPDDQLADVLGRFAPPLFRGPAAPPATARSSRRLRGRSSTCWSRAPAARTTRSPGAARAGDRTGAARIPLAWSGWWPTASAVPRPRPAHERVRGRAARAAGGAGDERRSAAGIGFPVAGIPLVSDAPAFPRNLSQGGGDHVRAA